MRFESKFGIGEVVSKLVERKDGTIVIDLLAEVVGVEFSKTNQNAVYACRSNTGQILLFSEQELIGDPEFNQELGRYPIGMDDETPALTSVAVQEKLDEIKKPLKTKKSVRN